MLTDEHTIPPTPLWVQLYETEEFGEQECRTAVSTMSRVRLVAWRIF